MRRGYRNRPVFRLSPTLLELMTAVYTQKKAYSQLLINRVSQQYDIGAGTALRPHHGRIDYIRMTDVYAGFIS